MTAEYVRELLEMCSEGLSGAANEKLRVKLAGSLIEGFLPKKGSQLRGYYLDLINWDDPDDPIRQLIIPREEELTEWGTLDASNEESVTVAHGVQHKYTDTVLLLCNEVCGAYCRYCFRKRLFMDDNDEVTNDVSEGLRYIAEHPEVTNVLLTGGDPLLMSTRRLVDIFEALRAIPHVKIIRLGSKMPAFDPYRVLNDAELQEAFRQSPIRSIVREV